MAISYDKLWNLVRKNKMKNGDLAKAAEISGDTQLRSWEKTNLCRWKLCSVCARSSIVILVIWLK